MKREPRLGEEPTGSRWLWRLLLPFTLSKGLALVIRGAEECRLLMEGGWIGVLAHCLYDASSSSSGDFRFLSLVLRAEVLLPP